MNRVLILNAGPIDDGFEQGLFHDTLQIGRHLGPADPADMPTAAVRETTEGIVSVSAAHDVGAPADWPACRILVRMGVGHDSIDGAAWGAAGVPLCNVPDYGTSEVADHAIALMLALVRGTTLYHERLAQDAHAGWSFAGAPNMRRLRGAVFGVVGLGRIGLAAALRARGFGMEVAFFDPYAPNGLEIAVGARRVNTLPELMAMSDVLSVHAPLSAETRGLIGRDALAAAKPDLVVVNTARGPIVDLDALTDALEAGRIGGAGLDVLPVEPPEPGTRLLRAVADGAAWTKGRVVLTPHAAFYSPDALADMRRKAMEVVLYYLRDGRLTNCVNLVYLREPRR